MSVASKLKGLTAGLGEALDKKDIKKSAPSSRAAPVQMLEARYQMTAYEDKIAALEARVKDLETTALRVADISPNPWQPRRLFNEAKLQELASSISTVDLIQPITVRRVRTSDTSSDQTGSVRTSDTYQIVAGERRWRAHKLLGKTEIIVRIVEASDTDMRVLAIAENHGREDLTDYEYALSIRNHEEDHANKKSLAAALGKNRTELYQYLAFFKLPAFILEDLEVSPELLGRTAAEDIAITLKKHGNKALESLKALWPRVKSGDLDQGKIAANIESAVVRGEVVKTNRDIKKLFVGKEQAGSITRDASHLAIKIRSVALTPEMESELRAFVEKMFHAGPR
jgi:ParB family chromosome partitioning protein